MARAYNQTGLWKRAKSEFPTSLEQNSLLNKLERELWACSKSRRCGCEDCPKAEECWRIWTSASDCDIKHRLRLEEYEGYRGKLITAGVIRR